MNLLGRCIAFCSWANAVPSRSGLFFFQTSERQKEVRSVSLKLLHVSVCLTVVSLVCPAWGADPKSAVETAAIAVFSLDGPLVESPRSDDFLFGSLGSESLHDLLERMERAKDDRRVRAVVLLIGDSGLGLAQVEEVRRVLDDIKAAGKEVYAHAESLSLASYALACGASRLSVVPTADLWIVGLYSESPYLRGLLDKIGVKPDFLACGAYKSAAEIFMRTGPSPEAEAMQNWLMDSLFATSVDLIASGRRVPAEKVRAWIDGGPYTAAKALQSGMIDAVEFRQDFMAELKKKFGENAKFLVRYGKSKDAEIDLSSPLGVFKLWADMLQRSPKKKATKDAVALVYVDGPILPGKGSPTLFGSDRMAYSTPIRKALDQAAEDPAIKAVVLRVDSPGGSATASEIILDATKRVKAKKPFAVSMGSVAGSGGYYVACGGGTVFADASTITGSIGVVGGKFATTEMWNRLGVAWKSYRRGASAGILATDGVFTPEERAKFQAWMDEIYQVFQGHVAAARGDRLKKKLEELAGGRVFTGQQAFELGLVDKIGSLREAIRHVAEQAKLKNYEVRVLPRPKNFLEALLEDLEAKESEAETISLTALIALRYRTLRDALWPQLQTFEPQRLAAIQTALVRLSLIQEQRAVLMMPETVILDRRAP